jgi:hypothetical protein
LVEGKLDVIFTSLLKFPDETLSLLVMTHRACHSVTLLCSLHYVPSVTLVFLLYFVLLCYTSFLCLYRNLRVIFYSSFPVIFRLTLLRWFPFLLQKSPCVTFNSSFLLYSVLLCYTSFFLLQKLPSLTLVFLLYIMLVFFTVTLDSLYNKSLPLLQ